MDQQQPQLGFVALEPPQDHMEELPPDEPIRAKASVSFIRLRLLLFDLLLLGVFLLCWFERYESYVVAYSLLIAAGSGCLLVNFLCLLHRELPMHKAVLGSISMILVSKAREIDLKVVMRLRFLCGLLALGAGWGQLKSREEVRVACRVLVAAQVPLLVQWIDQVQL